MRGSFAEDLSRCVGVLLRKMFIVVLRTSHDACEFCSRTLTLRVSFAEDS